MDKVILIKNGELVLKGLNRSTFEDILVKNVRRRLKSLGEYSYMKTQSTVIVAPEDEAAAENLQQAAQRVSRVFGISAYSVAAVCEKDMDAIKQTAYDFLSEQLSRAGSFKVNAKRSDKSFKYKSPQICAEVGGYLLSRVQPLKVDVHNPALTVTVEVRDNSVFIHGNQLKGAGGMPTGTSGRALLLLSGGIDSPVAGYMMAKRGLILDAVHFASPPYTSTRAQMKVEQLAEIVSRYSGRIRLHVCRFTELQESIKDNCPEEVFTVIMRRMMMRVAEQLAAKNECKALITGESLGQVASQTMDALRCTDKVCTMPVFRPLIGMDKQEIVELSCKIDAFETSLLPFEDCCTVFTPKHPKTRPDIEYVERAEALFDYAPMVLEAAQSAEEKLIG